MKKLALIIALLLPLAAIAQTALYLYQRSPGDTVTFAWDHEPLRTGCGIVDRAATQMGCNATATTLAKIYPVVWTGGQVKITGAKSDGSDLMASVRYRFRGFKVGGTGIALAVTQPGSYTFTIPTSGRYVCWGYVALDSTTGMDSFLTSMDGAPQTIWDTLPGVAGQWGWDRINARSGDAAARGPAIVYNLSAGSHTLVIAERETGTQINGIVIAAEDSAAPVIDEQVIQGETESDTAPIPLSFGAGLIRLEVQTVQTWDGVDLEPSAWARSDDATFATVDQAARGWLVQVQAIVNDILMPTRFRLLL